MLDNQLYFSFLINSILFYWSSCRVRFCKCLKDSLFTCWLRFSGNFNIWQAWWVVHVKMFESISSQSKISSRFGKFRNAFLSTCSIMLSERSSFVTNELISTKFELVKFFKRFFSKIVFIFEVFETWAESKMSMLPGNEKSLLLVLMTPGDRVN